MSNMTPILQKVFDDFVAAEQERDALKLENAVLKARVAELEAEVERLRVIALPEITKEIAARWALPYPCLIGSNEDDEWEWTKDAAEFVALLNAGRTK